MKGRECWIKRARWKNKADLQTDTEENRGAPSQCCDNETKGPERKQIHSLKKKKKTPKRNTTSGIKVKKETLILVEHCRPVAAELFPPLATKTKVRPAVLNLTFCTTRTCVSRGNVISGNRFPAPLADLDRICIFAAQEKRL